MVDQLSLAEALAPKASAKAKDIDTTDIQLDPLKGGDVYKWSIEQAAHIRAGRFDKVDLINVADEIESVGKSEFRSLAGNLAVVLAHMLKWDYQPAKRSRSWVNSIIVHRVHVDDDLQDNESLRASLDEAVRRGYRLGRASAAAETDLPLRTFPTECPYDWDAIMTRLFVLDQTDEAS